MTVQEFYDKWMIDNSCYDIQGHWERDCLEQFRNDFSKAFGYPQGHRWKIEGWYELQDEAFSYITEKGHIYDYEKEFHCQKVPF